MKRTMTRTMTTTITTTLTAPTARRKNLPAAVRRRLVYNKHYWLLAGINDFLVAVVEFSFSVHCVQRISLLSFLNSKSASSQWENSLEGEDFI